jgi:DTW domain-containing protein YfiP
MRSRRAERCLGCGLTPGLCLCGEITPSATRTHVLLLVHHVEVHKPTNTARLALRALSQAHLRVCGREAPGEPVQPSARRLLLFPGEGARPLVQGEGLTGHPVQLIVPDGTWSQARRIARRELVAQAAELVCLPDCPTSRYDLRRNVRPGGLCTLEAIARALAILEQPELEPALLGTLDRFVERSRSIRSGAAR